MSDGTAPISDLVEGSRVVTLYSSSATEVRVYGYGTYRGLAVPDENAVWHGQMLRKMKKECPWVQLDDGRAVWGYECHIGLFEGFLDWVGDRTLVIEDIAISRALVLREVNGWPYPPPDAPPVVLQNNGDGTFTGDLVSLMGGQNTEDTPLTCPSCNSPVAATIMASGGMPDAEAVAKIRANPVAPSFCASCRTLLVIFKDPTDDIVKARVMSKTTFDAMPAHLRSMLLSFQQMSTEELLRRFQKKGGSA